MSDENGLTEAEQKYFDSQGAEKPEGVVDTIQPEGAEPAKTTEPAKAAEPKKAEPDKADPDPEPLKVVDKRALDEERNRRKELQKQNAEMRANLERLTGRLDILQGTKPRTEEAPLIPTEKPIEAVTELYEDLQRRRQSEQQQTAHQQFMGQYSAQAAEFSQKTPDFKEAYQFLLNDRAAELKEAFGLDGIALENALRSNEMEIAAIAMQQGTNPAERIYQLAKRRGYTGKPETTETPAVDPAKATADALLKATSTLAGIAKGQEKSKSLSSAGGAGSDGLPPIEELLAMDTDEFDKLTKNPRAWKKIASGN